MVVCDKCGHDPEQDLNKTKAEVLAEHYQKVNEAISALWQERNKSFLVLLIITCIELLLFYHKEFKLADFLATILNTYLKTEPKYDETSIEKSFPLYLLISLLLVYILYLMILLHQRTSFINSTYTYLEKTETEVRKALGFVSNTNQDGETQEGEKQASFLPFSFHGEFYKDHLNKDFIRSITGVTYVVILLILFVGLFFAVWNKSFSEIFNDKDSYKKLFDFVNSFLAIPILIYFIGYSLSTFKVEINRRSFENLINSGVNVVRTIFNKIKEFLENTKSYVSKDKWLKVVGAILIVLLVDWFLYNFYWLKILLMAGFLCYFFAKVVEKK